MVRVVRGGGRRPARSNVHLGEIFIGDTMRRRRVIRRTLLTVIAAASIVSLTEADGRDHEWLSYNGDLANHRYAAQDQINTRNIAQLGAIWVSEPFAESATSRMTPLVHNGRMFLA